MTSDATIVAGVWTPWLAPIPAFGSPSPLAGWWESRWQTVAVLYERDDIIQCAVYDKTTRVVNGKGCGIGYTRDSFLGQFAQVPPERWPQP